MTGGDEGDKEKRKKKEGKKKKRVFGKEEAEQERRRRKIRGLRCGRTTPCGWKGCEIIWNPENSRDGAPGLGAPPADTVCYGEKKTHG